MRDTSDIARAIFEAVTAAQSEGKIPSAILLDDATRESIQAGGLGYWSAGPATWALFNVPVMIGDVQGWRLDLT